MGTGDRVANLLAPILSEIQGIDRSGMRQLSTDHSVRVHFT